MPPISGGGRSQVNRCACHLSHSSGYCNDHRDRPPTPVEVILPPSHSPPPPSIPPHPPPPTLSPHGDVQKAMSSGGVLTSYSQPLKSRYIQCPSHTSILVSPTSVMFMYHSPLSGFLRIFICEIADKILSMYMYSWVIKKNEHNNKYQQHNEAIRNNRNTTNTVLLQLHVKLSSDINI